VARHRVENYPDVVTLAQWTWRRFHRPGEKETKETELAENSVPSLKPRPCWEDMVPDKAIYQHAYAPGKWELIPTPVCRNKDWSLILQPGQNPMDDDDPDEAPRKKGQ
jgi:hypothetical protein